MFTAVRSASNTRVVSGGGSTAGNSASTSVTTSTVRCPALAAACAAKITSCIRCPAAAASSAATPGAASSTVRAETAAAALRAMVSLPTPSGPVSSTPSRAEPPSRVSSSGWPRLSCSHSTSRRAVSTLPTRASIGSTGSAGAVVAGAVTPVIGPAGAVRARAGAPARCGSGSPVASPPCQPTTVLGRMATAPAGSTPATVNSSVVHELPNAPATCRRAAGTSRPGAGWMSCGSNDTASPPVTILPISASRTVSGGSAARASGEPVSSTCRAGCTLAGPTTTGAPSASPVLDSVTSSTVAWPGGPAAGATSAVVTRAPVSVTASQDRNPSASITSGCSRTTPRRASAAEAATRATRVIESLTPARYRPPTRSRGPRRVGLGMAPDGCGGGRHQVELAALVVEGQLVALPGAGEAALRS